MTLKLLLVSGKGTGGSARAALPLASEGQAQPPPALPPREPRAVGDDSKTPTHGQNTPYLSLWSASRCHSLGYCLSSR